MRKNTWAVLECDDFQIEYIWPPANMHIECWVNLGGNG